MLNYEIFIHWFSLLRKVQPERIFHLAAQSFVTTSFDAPADTLHTNVIGTTNLLDAIRLTEIDTKVHVCSSSEVYGQVLEDEVPIKESNPFRPSQPVCGIQGWGGHDCFSVLSYLMGLRTYRTRMFTHTGPRRGDVLCGKCLCQTDCRSRNRSSSQTQFGLAILTVFVRLQMYEMRFVPIGCC